MNTKHTFVLTTLASAMMTVFAAGAAEDDEYEVDLTPLISFESNLSVGIGHFNGDREQFGMFDGVRGSESVLMLDGDVRMRDDETGTWTTATFRNLGLDSQEATVGYEQQGDWGIQLHYNQMPRYAPYTVNTGLIGIGSDSLIVSNPSITPGSGNDVVPGTQREIVGIYFHKYLMPRLSLKVDFKNEEKDGTRHWGRGGQPEFMIEPIDWTTRQMEMSLNYAGKKFQMAGGYYGSWYTNANTLVDTIRAGDDPLVLANHIYLSQPLDNQAHQIFVDGGYSFTPTMRGSFKASYTHATQDEYIPTAGIAGLADPAAPSSLDGEVNTTMMQLGITARPLPDLNLVANLRYNDVDDKTPAWLVVTGGTQVHSTPLSYETLSAKLEGIYRLTDRYSVIAGIDQKNQDRDVPFGGDINPVDGLDDERYVPFRTELDETTYRVQLRRSLSDTLNGSLAYLHSERDGTVYSDAIHSLGGINPINISDRDRDKWRLTLDWMATDRINLQFNFEDAKDDYGPDSNPYGLFEGKARMYSIDADYSISNKWQVTAWVSHDDTEAEQFGGRWDRITEDHEVDKYSELKDEGDSVGMG
ncbi:MAG TPA: MtrB/PioB family decaheme-associated outer membrane protein, partial [Gammaproteobacteria bacterium]